MNPSHSLAESLGSLVAVRLVGTQEPAPVRLLTDAEQATFAAIEGTAREATWLRGRQALKILMADGDCQYDTTQLTFPHPYISLTHCRDTAIAVELTPQVVPVGWKLCGTGVDFERYRPIRTAAARFFLTEEERRGLPFPNLERQADSQRQAGYRGCQDRRGDAMHRPALLRLWTIKEALFKADPDNETRVIGDYHITHSSAHAAAGTAIVGNSEGICFHFASLATKTGYLSVAMSMRRT
jgi:hypothetical protein